MQEDIVRIMGEETEHERNKKDEIRIINLMTKERINIKKLKSEGREEDM